MVLKHAPLGEINLPFVASNAIIPRCRRNRCSFRIGPVREGAAGLAEKFNLPTDGTDLHGFSLAGVILFSRRKRRKHRIGCITSFAAVGKPSVSVPEASTSEASALCESLRILRAK